MAQVALGAVGAIIGSFTPAGPALGWAIGSAIGGVLFPPKGPHSEGPRLTDLKSQVSTYGAPKGLVYGRCSIAGCVIWAADVVEIVTTEEGGKGEPESSSTTYTYTASFAILICKGPMHSLTRIWANGRCIYDIRDPTNIDAMIASQNFARYFKWYPGSDSQLPDPTIEAALGVGNVPGYRGRCYIVFTNLPLALFNNYPPGAINFQFEVQRLASESTGITHLAEAEGNITLGSMYPVVNGIIRVATYGVPATSERTSFYRSDGTFIVNRQETAFEAQWPMPYYEWTFQALGTTPLDYTNAVMLMFDGSTVRAVKSTAVGVGDAAFYFYAELGGQGGPRADQSFLFATGVVIQAVIPCANRRHVLVQTAPSTIANVDTWHILEWNGTAFSIASTGTVVDPMPPSVGNSSQGQGSAAGMLESDLRYIWSIGALSGPFIGLYWINDDDELVEVDTLMLADGFAAGAANIWADNGLAYTIAGDGYNFYHLFSRLEQPGDNQEILSGVVTDLAERASLTASQINVTALTSIDVDGFIVASVGAARPSLQHLERSYWFDSVETGGKIKFVLRGGSSVVTIPQADLAAVQEVGNETAPVITNERADEDSLPRAINVAYLTKDADYQNGVQTAQRESVVTTQPTNIELPLVLEDLKAKQVGEVLLYDAWQGRVKRTFKTSRKYAYLEPTDVVTLELDDVTYVVRIIAMRMNGGILEFEALDEAAAVYEPNSVAGVIIDPNPPIVLVGPTFIALMDLPLLRSMDSDAGFYFAACGYNEIWAGMRLFVSTDGGANYSAITATTTAATMGTCGAALADHTGGNFYDTKNTVTVSLLHGTLTSVTDAQLLAGANACVIGSEENGWEILQFKTATLSSGSTYVLSNLLRGRRGTEHLMSTHEDYEKFVLLSVATMLRIAGDVATLNSERLYKGVTFFETIADAEVVPFTNTGAALKPYSPVHVRIHRDPATSDLTIYWIRRGRINNEWMNNVDVPLNEASESYSIEIYSGATLKRTLTSSVQSVAYTAAQETTDFGAPQSSLSLRIYQVSADVGNGFGFIDTVSVIS